MSPEGVLSLNVPRRQEAGFCSKISLLNLFHSEGVPSRSAAPRVQDSFFGHLAYQWCVLQLYKYSQRPAPLSKAQAEAARKGDYPTLRPICGQPISFGGRAMATLTPPFPLVTLSSPPGSPILRGGEVDI